MRSTALLAAALALASCSPRDLLFAELEVPAVGITIPGQEFPASTANPSALCAPDQTDCVQADIAWNLGEQVDLLNEPDAHYQVRLTDIALELTSTSAGVTTFEGIRSVSIEVFLPGETQTTLIASYTRPPGAAPTAIAVSGNANVDLAPYLDAGKVNVRVKMAVDAPTPAFTADVRAVFYVKVRLDYGHMI